MVRSQIFFCFCFKKVRKNIIYKRIFLKNLHFFFKLKFFKKYDRLNLHVQFGNIQNFICTYIRAIQNVIVKYYILLLYKMF